MARIFALEEIQKGLITTVEDITALAQALMALPTFQNGTSLLFGSVAWSLRLGYPVHTWRSDLDVYSPANLTDHGIRPVFRDRYGDNGDLLCSRLVQFLSSNNPGGLYAPFTLSRSTRDHLRQLSRSGLAGKPYREFFRRLQRVRGPRRHEEIVEYVHNAEREYLRRLEAYLHGGRTFVGSLFDHAPSIENFPRHLMRKLLGFLKLLPRPDIAANVEAQFDQLQEDWAEELRQHFVPFRTIDEQYAQLVETVRSSPEQWDQHSYRKAVSQLFVDLPVSAICDVICRRFPNTSREYRRVTPSEIRRKREELW